MHLKRYQRQTVQEALRAVREELGPDALVLSTRLVAAPGPRGWIGRRLVEVTAAADRLSVPEVRQQTAGDAPAARALPPRPNAKTRPADAIAARLRATGLDAALAQDVADAHPRTGTRGVSLRTISATLAEQLAPLVANDDRYAPIEMFVGPPGVGKTTTIAKIAAQERARRGTRLGLVAADAFRVGAVEQMRLYANLLGSPLSVARTPYELMTAIELATGPVLIDTAGRSPADDASRDMLRVGASRPDTRTHLVLAADMPPDAMRRLMDRFACARPSRLVLTRVDEVGSLAPVVAALRECRIPISYLGTGQRVPDDLQTASPRVLAGWVTGDAAARGAVA
jgi:flagellar biosynthesis protein FlhF